MPNLYAWWAPQMGPQSSVREPLNHSRLGFGTSSEGSWGYHPLEECLLSASEPKLLSAGTSVRTGDRAARVGSRAFSRSPRPWLRVNHNNYHSPWQATPLPHRLTEPPWHGDDGRVQVIKEAGAGQVLFLSAPYELLRSVSEKDFIYICIKCLHKAKP